MHEPLSQTLARIAGELPADKPVTLNEIIDRIGPRGPFGVLIVLSLPFVTPVTLPGISNVLGAVMFVIAWKLARGIAPHLPKRAGARPFSASKMVKVLHISTKVLRFIEKFARPRRTPWLASTAARVINAIVIAIMAGMLALPIPPTIPLSNMLPGYAIIILAMSLMEEDGWLILAGYVVSLGTVAYLTTMTILQAEAISVLYSKYFHRIIEWFR
jgi:hypothetical protein